MMFIKVVHICLFLLLPKFKFCNGFTGSLFLSHPRDIALFSRLPHESDESIRNKIEIKNSGEKVASSYNCRVDRRNAFLKLGLITCSFPIISSAPSAEAAIANTDSSFWTQTKPSLLPEEETYPDQFVNLLTRFLVNYDTSLRSWWISQADYIVVTPNANATADILKQRQNQFESLETSVEASLESQNGKFDGPKGAEILLSALLRSYGDKDKSAVILLCGIFSLLSVDNQPTLLIGQQMEQDIMENNETKTTTTASNASPVIPPVVLPQDFSLVKLPPDLYPRRPENEEVGPFQANINVASLPFLRRSKSQDHQLLAPLVSRERTLDPSTYARFFAAGAMASGLAHGALTPVDMLKTRLQTQPDKYAKGPIVAASTIFKEEGIGAFATGLGPTAAGYFLAGSIAFGVTEILKRLSISVLGPQFVLNNPFLVVLGCGAIAVSLCQLVLTPFEVARIRLVDDSSFAPSLPKALARLAREEGGVLGFYKGTPALLIKEVPFHATKFAVFDTVSSFLKASAFFADFLSPVALTVTSGVLAGVAAVFISQPADATFTRCQQPLEDGGKLSPVGAFSDLLENGGIWAGFGSRCFFGASLVSLQFFCYDAAKSLFHITAGDLSIFLDAFAGLSSSSA